MKWQSSCCVLNCCRRPIDGFFFIHQSIDRPKREMLLEWLRESGFTYLSSRKYRGHLCDDEANSFGKPVRTRRKQWERGWEWQYDNDNKIAYLPRWATNELGEIGKIVEEKARKRGEVITNKVKRLVETEMGKRAMSWRKTSKTNKLDNVLMTMSHR